MEYQIMTFEWPKFYQARLVKQAFGGSLLSSYCIALEAWRRGLEVKVTHPRLRYFSVSDGVDTIRFDYSRPSPLTTREAIRTALNKQATTDALRAAGVNAPETFQFEASTDSFDEVAGAAKSVSYPVVLKPLSGSKGDGVIVGIEDETELRRAHEWLTKTFGASKFVLEKFYTGIDLRIYVMGTSVVAAGIRIPANVVGDGTHTVRELIDLKNAVRRENPFLSGGLIQPDFEVDGLLEKQGYSYDSVPPEGVNLKLRNKANASAGGDFSDQTDALPQHILEAAVRAVGAIPGLASAGVDVLYDASKPAGEDHTVIEINSRAHIGVNMYPTEGTGQDVPKAIIDGCFPDSARMTAPGTKNLGFNFQECAGPLKSGVASAVTIAPIPRGGFPMRRRYVVMGAGAMSESQKKRLLAASSQHQLAGFFKEGSSTLVIGGRKSEVEAFCTKASEIIGKPLGEGAVWRQPLYIGFAIHDR